MRKLSLFVVIALLLSLLVAVGTPVSAGKPKPPGEKVKNVPKGQANGKQKDKNTPPGQAKPKNGGASSGVVAPDDSPEPGQTTGGTVVICHKPGTQGQKTIVVAASNFAGHIRHGDTKGPCETQSPVLTPTLPLTLPLGATAKISICHKPGTPAEKVLWLPASAIPGHRRHGDEPGDCTETTAPPTSTVPMTPTTPVTPSMMPTLTQRVTICHKFDTPAEKVLVLPRAALAGHIGHGDYEGTCDDVRGSPTSTVPSTSTLPVTSGVPTDTWRILICHKPGTAAEQTLALPAADVPEHLAHFDTLGACEGAPSLTWATELVIALTRWLMQLFA